jgi:ABC-type nitrate/sulfonate/bicarbonate transport system substrate-binding protein
MKSLGRTIDMLGAYQGAGAFTMRAWADKNKDTLERYLAAYIESVRFVRAPANKAASIAILVGKLRLTAKEAERTYELLLDPAFGFTPDAAFDREGFKNVLALRAELERKAGSEVPPPERYLDLGYYERAMKLVGR